MIFGEIFNGVVVKAILCNQEWADAQPGEWVLLPDGVGIGWFYDGVNFTNPEDGSPPPNTTPAVTQNFILTGWEWVERFTDEEWAWLKNQRNSGTTGGKKLDKLMDAVRWTDSINVASEKLDPFYDWLVANGIPGGQTRVDELRAARDS